MSKLEQLADNMTRHTPGDSWSHEKLPHGLEIVLHRSGRSCRLAVAREDPVQPSDTEVQVVLNAFHVPEGCELERKQVRRCHKATGRQIIYNVAQVHWTELC